MTLSRKDFVRLTVVAVGSASLASILPGCGGSTTESDAGMGGGAGGGSMGGGSGGGTGGGSGGGGGDMDAGTGGGGGGDMDAGTGGGGGGDMDAGTGGGGGSMSTCDTNGAHDSAISANHGHALMVPAADFMATGDKTYDITGTSAHSHSITLTQAQRMTIASGGMVTVQSTVGAAHTHMVTVACA